MHKFPNVIPIVKPLYTTPRQRSLDVETPRKRSNSISPLTKSLSEDGKYKINIDSQAVVHYFDFRDELKIDSSNMYEPVKNTCITILPKINNDYTIPSDEETQNKEIKNSDNRIKANVIPVKPPRRLKLQKVNQNTSINNENCNQLPTNQFKNSYGDNTKKIQNKTEEYKVDLDDINRLTIECEKNFKNIKLVSVSVQATPYPPYRLRILPKITNKIKSDREKCNCTTDRINTYCITTSRWMFSQCGLTIIIIIWALLGAAAFHETEGPREREQAEDLSAMQHNLAVSLATELRQIVPHEPVWLSMVQNYFAKHETLLLQAVSSGYGEGGGGGHIWSYPGCVLFAVSLLTTLGFGAPVPRTTLGRGAAVLFSAVGIPLHFLLIFNIGVLLASKLQKLSVNDKNKQNNKPSNWLKWFPFAVIACYYTLGVILFGFIRQRNFADSLLFPLDFTATGGVAQTLGHVRIFYALYLEIAVTLAATVVALFQVSASQAI